MCVKGVDVIMDIYNPKKIHTLSFSCGIPYVCMCDK